MFQVSNKEVAESYINDVHAERARLEGELIVKLRNLSIVLVGLIGVSLAVIVL